MKFQYRIKMIDGGDPDAVIPVFVVEVETIGPDRQAGTWTESFGSLDTMNAFLLGIQCANAMHGYHEFVPSISSVVLNWNRPCVLWPAGEPVQD